MEPLSAFFLRADLFERAVWAWIIFALALVPVQLLVAAPYGRHFRPSWGPSVDNRLGWVLMEAVSPLVFALFFLALPGEKDPVRWFLFGCWMTHYLNRSFIFPLRLRTQGKKIPVAIVLSAVFFNVLNGYFNGYALGVLSPGYRPEYISDPRFLIGAALFFAGAAINILADEKLLHLRRPGESGYRIPQGRLFRYLSCPNHFGEVLEWIGFALIAWNLAAFSFAIWTAANLIPRAISHHRWYRLHFPHYPPERKAVIPFIL